MEEELDIIRELRERFDSGEAVSERYKQAYAGQASEVISSINEMDVYRDVVESFPDGIVVLNLERRIVLCNTAVSNLLGFSRNELFGKSFEDVVHKDTTKYLKTIEDVLEDGLGRTIQLDLQRKDGSHFMSELHIGLLKAGLLEEGRAVWIVIRDITERKEIEDLKERFKDIAFSCSDFIWEIDKQGRYTFVVGKVERTLGYSPEELLGKTLFDFMPEEEATGVRRILENPQPIVDLENWNLTKDGKMVCLLTNGTPILDEMGNLLGYRGVHRDITKYKRAIEELRENEERFRAISESAHDAILMINDRGNIDYWNNGAEEMFGYRPNEIVGKNLHRILVPDHGSNPVGNIVGKIMELNALKKNGKRFTVESSSSTVRLGGRPYTIWIMRDISERKAIEEELKEKLDELETFYKVAVDRELRMIELKKEINELCEKCGEKPRYDVR
jgi:PAS domain S-box-containing protein